MLNIRPANWSIALVCLLAALFGAPAFAQAGDQAIYSDRGAATCMKCHDTDTKLGNRVYKAATEIFQTPHSMKGDARSPFGQHECESCHGPSEAHVQSTAAAGQRKTAPAVVFKGPNASPVEERNRVCLGCHQSGLRMNWAGSQHQDSKLACVSCHTIHVKKDPILVKATQPEVCFGCHAEQRALTMQYSHHPVREGKVACSDCHNPHGSPGPHLLKEARVTDTCYGCHAEKRGPFLWEHQPVREDCTNCHNPHGSVNPRLLKEKVPFLCLDCHAATNDMGGVGVSKQSVAAHSGSLYLYGDRSCLNCHSNIHGSNSPSGSTFFR
jgi:DmsE family decaheme c-type cytochrome